MKPASIKNHERYLKLETQKLNKIALNQLRSMVYAEMKPIVQSLIFKAKHGDHKSAEVLFDRTFGKAKESLDINHTFSLASLAERWAEQEKNKQSALPPTIT